MSELLEGHPADKFQRNEIKAACFAKMIGLNDIRVDQVGHQPGFANEIIDELLLVRIILADDFDGNAFDEVPRAVLLGFIHNAHAALENFPHNLVPELVLDCEESHKPML